MGGEGGGERVAGSVDYWGVIQKWCFYEGPFLKICLRTGLSYSLSQMWDIMLDDNYKT